MKRLTSFSALECDEIKEEVHYRQIEEIFNKLAKIGDVNCVFEVGYEDELNKDTNAEIMEGNISDLEEVLSNMDNKSGIDVFVDKNKDIIFKVYGSFYKKDDKHHMNITRVKLQGIDKGEKLHLGEIFEGKIVNNKKDRDLDR